MKLTSNSNFLTYIIVATLIIFNIFLLYKISGDDNNTTGDSYSEIEEIKGQDLNFNELSNYFSDLAKKKGGAYAYKALTKATAFSYLPDNIDTHLLGHVVGDVLYKQEGVLGMKYCTHDLRNACSHSIVVGSLLENGIGAVDEVVDSCHGAPGGKGAYRMCVHGLGHGVLAYVEYDMKTAVELCKKVGDPKTETMEFGECVGGVTMEMMAGVHDQEVWQKQKPNYLKEDDPLSPCNMDFIPTEGKSNCYTFLTPNLFEAAGADLGRPGAKDFEIAFKYCDDVPEASNRLICYGNFGKEFVVLVNDRNVQSVENLDDDKLRTIYEWCNLAGDKDGTSACIDTALQSLYWGGENDRSAAVRFCAVLEDDYNRNGCHSSLIGAVSFYIEDSQYKKDFCSELPPEYRTECEDRLLRTN